MGLQETTIGDLISLQRGYDLPEGQRRTGTVPVIGSAGLTGYHDTAKVKGPGVTLGRSGASFGKVTFVNEDYWPHNATLFVTNFKGNDPLFIRYLLESIDFSYLNSGAAQQSLNRNYVYGVKAPDFPLHLQQRVVAVLSAYDNLVENNQRRIRILEEMAQSLYREWFVHFRSPGHEKIKIIDSRLGPIPQGWGIAALGDYLSELQSGKRPKGGINADERGVPSVGAENINGLGNYNYDKDKFVSAEFFQSMTKGIVKNQDVMLYKDGAYIGKTSYFRDDFPHSKCSINEHVFILRSSEPLTQNWLYFMISQKEMRDQIIGTNANAAQPGINQQSVRGLSFIFPPEELIQKFSETSEPILALLFNLAKRNRNLSRTRDLLLSKLISGEIDLSFATSELEEAA